MTLRLALLVALVGCVPVRRATLAVTPTVPPAAGPSCPAAAWRCNGLVPERCVATDGEARWFPTHPLGADLRPAPCAARCVVDGEPAASHCAAAEVSP